MLALLLCASCSDDGRTKSAGEPVATCDCPIDWAIENVALCVAPPTNYSPPVIFSSHLDGDGNVACDTTQRFPQPVSREPWSAQRITSRCRGKGTLTLRVRQGKAREASDEDCMLNEQTFDFDYAQPNRSLALAEMAAWSAQVETCARAFEDAGGYFEFRVDSETLGCGAPGEKVNYIDICLASCHDDPTRAGCEACDDRPERNRL
jgi:hypothetical protein